jgi:hypothetical protein
VTRPSRRSAFSKTNRMDWSSSTIQIGFMSLYFLYRGCTAFRSGQRNQNFEISSARRAFTLNQTVVLLNKGLRQREP